MRSLTFILTLLISLSSYCSDVLWNYRLEGSSISGGSFLVEDGDYNNLSSGTFYDIPSRSFGYIRLGMGEVPGTTYFSGVSEYSVRVRITPYNNSGVMQPSFTQDLAGTYSSMSNSLTLDAEDYRLLGVHKFLVEVVHIVATYTDPLGNLISSGFVTTLPNYVYLEGGYSSERYYQLNTSQVPLIVTNYISYDANGVATILYNQGATATSSTTDELDLSWNYVDGAEYYDLEWAWLDNYSASSLGSILSQGQVNLTELDFTHNSTRIRTSEQHYRIPQIFGKGYLVYRVRGVGRWLDDVSKDKYGAWSGNTSTKNVVSDWSNVITIGSEHEGLKNWQYDAMYAEGGKKKEVAQYFDGSSRPRQVVTRLSSDNHLLVGETVYDNEGRGVIQILPVPQSNPGIKYYPKLNTNVSGVPYNYKDFDLEAQIETECYPALASGMSTSSGASKYYSPGGHVGETDWQQYVPDAEGYPFTQIEYTPDNTGRIRNKGEAGPKHQIGGGHQTIHYYLQPAQEELDRLFGYKVGFKQRYKKNMVVDANGQVNITYLDASGKVIATALSGDNPSSLIGLDSEGGSAALTTDILGKLNAVDVNTPNDDNELMVTGRFGGYQDGLKTGKQIAIAQDELFDFTYTAQSSYFTAACGENGIHYPFVYDLKLSLKDDCGNEYFPLTYQALTLGDQAFSSTVTDYLSLNQTALQLFQGSYTLSKEITVNEASLLAYKAHYLNPTTGCIEGPDAFSDEVSTDCDVSCAECVSDLGSLADYLAQAALDLGHELTVNETATRTAVYNSLRESCVEPCRPLSSCDVYREGMEGDLRPNGQYGGSSSDVLSVFNESNNQLTGHWRSAGVVYKDENGNTSYVPVSFDGTSYSPVLVSGVTPALSNGNLPGVYYVLPQQYQSVEDFKSVFEDSWSNALLPFHPEYPFYQYAMSICNGETEVSATSTTTTDDFMISSEVFNDLVMNQALNYTDATSLETTLDGLNFYTVNLLQGASGSSSYGGLYEIDPYFHQTYSIHNTIESTDGTAISITTLKNNLMVESLGNYDNTGLTMLQYAVRTAIYGNATSTPANLYASSWSDITSHYSPAQVDLIWQTYKSYYITTKHRINQFFMDLYGFTIDRSMGYTIPVTGSVTITTGLFNGAIGSGGVSTGVFPSFSWSTYYSQMITLVQYNYLHYTNPGSGWSVNATPIAFAGPEYDSKQIRITRYDALANPALPAQAVIDEWSAQAGYANWEATGICPLMVDMERFLDAQGRADLLKTSGSTATMPSFTPSLFTSFTGLAPTSFLSTMSVTVNSPSSGQPLILQFSAGASTQTFTIPELTSTLPWSNYGSGGSNWHIYGVSHSYPVPSSTNVKVLIRAGLSLATSEEYVVTYQSTVDLNGCQATYEANAGNLDPECDREKKFESAMLGLLQKLSSLNQFYSTGVDISTYPEYVNSVLPEYLGFDASVSTIWNGPNVNGIMGLQNGTNSYVYSIGLGYSTGMIAINSFDLIGSTVYLSGLVGGSTYSTASYSGPYTYQLNGVKPLVLDLSCFCGEEQSPEAALADYLTYIYTHTVSCGQQPAELLAIKKYLPFVSPVIYGSSVSGSTLTVRHAEQGTVCGEGTNPVTCDFSILSSSSFVSVSDVTFINGGFTFTGHLANGSKESVSVRSSCFVVPPCDDCVPDPEEPVSCSSTYDTYWSYMHSTFNYTGGDLTIFNEQYLVSEEVFCANGYAYIWDAYQHYLSARSITSVTDLYYLSLGQFGNTPIGYSNGKLGSALTAYSAYILGSGHEQTTWNNYVTNVYMGLHPEICPVSTPPVFPTGPFEEEPCNLWETFVADVNQQNQYDLYIASVGEQFTKDYLAEALSSLVETFTESHQDKEYHYTLYYYDRSGNLIQTVPPQGVDRLEVGESNTLTYEQMDALRVSSPGITANESGGNKQAPLHSMQTVYRYNSLNQLVYQSTPDGGESRFAYDALGRLVLSQNAKQKDLGVETSQRFSYTKYDALGRIAEAGELVSNSNNYSINDIGGLNNSGVPFVGLTGVNDPSFPVNLSSSRREVTRSIYDELKDAGSPITVPMLSGGPVSVSTLFESYSGLNTRNRIVGMIYQETYNSSSSVYNNATFYDYDVHGNAKELIQVNMDQALLDYNHHIKHVNYDYDLVSGNVNKVIYQKGFADQFIHRYSYDDDNRITHVETSKDGISFEKDAKYFYYDHGALARTELGEKKVVASDYAYTIQGWLKSVNGEQVDAYTMMGKDGSSGLNKYAGKDLYGYSLHYFARDYNSSNMSMLNYSSDVASMSAPSSSLYNGNIREIYTALSDKFEQKFKTHRTVYSYDQLNRIKSMDGTYMTINSSGTISSPSSGYNSQYSFDANGNLLTMKNWSALDNTESGAQQMIDDLSYKYYEQGPANASVPPTYLPGSSNNSISNASNRLAYVDDALGASVILGADIGDQYSGNYRYDLTGQLVGDLGENIGTTGTPEKILWTVTNKVKEISNTNNGDVIRFDYNTLGHRISKKVTHTNGNYEKTFYILDGIGNVMSTYTRNKAGNPVQVYLILSERNIYGENRIGMEQVSKRMSGQPQTAPAAITSGNVLLDQYIGDKRYELTNHLGNVLNVVADRKLPQELSTYFGRFDGSNDVAQSASFTAPISNQVTVECWVRTTFSGGGVSKGILAHSGTNSDVRLQMLDDGKILFLGKHGTASFYNTISTGSVNDGNWHHVAGTVSIGGSTTVWKTYIDGVLQSTNSYAVTSLFPALTANFKIGYGGTYFPGDIKEVSYWNTAKTATEVLADKNAGSFAGTESTLIGYWPLGDNVSPSHDLSSANHPVSMLNGAYFLGAAQGTVGSYIADVNSYSDYYPYGMQLPYRKGYESEQYRYGYQGSEMDNEIKSGEGKSYTTEFRQLDPRIGRWLSIDPVVQPWQSPYCSMDNKVIRYNDPKGDRIIGMSKRSGERAKDLLKNDVFAGEKFADFNKLLDLESDGKTFKKISQASFDAATKGLSVDEKALAKGYFEAINDDKRHVVSLLYASENVSKHTADALNTTKTPLTANSKASKIDDYYGGGVNYSTSQGDVTVIVLSSSAKVGDYKSYSNSYIAPKASSNGELLTHELIGHGLTLLHSYSEHNTWKNAILMTNLYLRTHGQPDIYRDGSNHKSPTEAVMQTTQNQHFLTKEQSKEIPSYLK